MFEGGTGGWWWCVDYKRINLNIVKQLFILIFMIKLGIVSLLILRLGR